MFDTLTATRTELETMAREFEPRILTGAEAVRVVTELGAIRRLVDGMLGKAAWRVEETSAHRRNGENDRDAAQLVGRALGADASEARRVIRTAKKVEKLPPPAPTNRTRRTRPMSSPGWSPPTHVRGRARGARRSRTSTS